MLGDLYCTASNDGKTLHVWSIFTNVEKKDSDFMQGFIKSHEVRYVAAVTSTTEQVGGGTIAYNTVLANNPIRVFDKAYLPGEEYRPQRVEVENFLRLR
jgi:hypothetical protein